MGVLLEGGGVWAYEERSWACILNTDDTQQVNHTTGSRVFMPGGRGAGRGGCSMAVLGGVVLVNNGLFCFDTWCKVQGAQH